jgi:hypothetical protein
LAGMDIRRNAAIVALREHFANAVERLVKVAH